MMHCTSDEWPIPARRIDECRSACEVCVLRQAASIDRPCANTSVGWALMSLREAQVRSIAPKMASSRRDGLFLSSRPEIRANSRPTRRFQADSISGDAEAGVGREGLGLFGS